MNDGKILFIINPKSGGKSNAGVEKTIKKRFPRAELVFTQRGGHATELAKEAAQNDYAAVIAVGGDGTLNEVAKALVHTNTSFGIVPRGSGNGFAREIAMPINTEKALEKLADTEPVLCDAAEINGEVFLNVAGVGIEADIAHAFAVFGTRGMLPYVWIAAKKFFTFKPKKLLVEYDGQTKETAPLTLVFANGRQYGNNFRIAPKAILTDNMLDMIELPNKNFLRLLIALPSFFSAKFRPFDPTLTTKIKTAKVTCAGPVIYHIDGEPKVCESGVLDIRVLPNAIKVLMPPQK